MWPDPDLEVYLGPPSMLLVGAGAFAAAFALLRKLRPGSRRLSLAAAACLIAVPVTWLLAAWFAGAMIAPMAVYLLMASLLLLAASALTEQRRALPARVAAGALWLVLLGLLVGLRWFTPAPDFLFY